MGSRFLFNEVVVQPTSLCNLNCSYCYVPYRDEDRRMQPAVMERLAESLAALPRHENPVFVLWHSGEPLAVSLDGPPAANARRVNWTGGPSFDKTMRGIERLKGIGCEIVLLAVVTEDQLDQAASLYEFFAGIGCVRLGINIEERVGINLTRKMVTSDRVSGFWADLYAAWLANPVIEIRELRLFADWWNATGGAAPAPETQPTYRSNYLPTVGYDGNVVFLSTELLQCHAGKYEKFEVGNLLTESLDDLVKKAKKTNYVIDFLAGVDACKASCEHYSFCGGGFATNKFFELGTMNGTETLACRNSRKRLFQVLDKIRRETHA